MVCRTKGRGHRSSGGSPAPVSERYLGLGPWRGRRSSETKDEDELWWPVFYDPSSLFMSVPRLVCLGTGQRLGGENVTNLGYRSSFGCSGPDWPEEDDVSFDVMSQRDARRDQERRDVRIQREGS